MSPVAQVTTIPLRLSGGPNLGPALLARPNLGPDWGHPEADPWPAVADDSLVREQSRWRGWEPAVEELPAPAAGEGAALPEEPSLFEKPALPEKSALPEEPSLFDDEAWAARRPPLTPASGSGPIRARSVEAAAVAAAAKAATAAETRRWLPGRTPILLRGTVAVALIGALAASWVRASGGSDAARSPLAAPVSSSAAAAAPAVTGCRVDHAVTGRGTGGYAVSVTVHNIGSGPIEGWSLQWPEGARQKITYGWNATVSLQGRRLTAQDAGFNHTILPGGQVSFGYTIGPDRPHIPPAGFTLNATPCTYPPTA